MEENIKETPKIKERISISPVVIMLFLVFVVSASAFLLGMKAFSSANINAKTEGLSPEGQDLLGDALAKTMRGLTNIQIAGKNITNNIAWYVMENRERETGLMHLIWIPGQKTLQWL